MSFLCNSILDCETTGSHTTFLPCCNAPISVDYQPQHIQEIYYAPEPPPQIQVVRQRLPDPPPDVIERVVVVPPPKQYVYQVVEVPTKPPPVIQERVVHQSPSAPLCGGTYHVKVPPKSAGQATTRVVKSTSGVLPSSSATLYNAPANVVYTTGPAQVTTGVPANVVYTTGSAQLTTGVPANVVYTSAPATAIPQLNL